MSNIPAYSKPVVPAALPTAVGELGMDSSGNLYIFVGGVAQQLSTYTGIPTRVTAGSTHVVPANIQEVAMFNVQVDGDIQFDGDWAFTQ
jgi:hypothetical protein